MEDYKQYLSEDADDAERDTAKQVMDGLVGMKLENKVAEVAAERRALLRQRFWMRTIWAVTLAAIAGVAVLFFWEKDNPSLPIEQPKPIEQIMPPQAPPVQERSNAAQQPIANRPTTQQEQAERPLVRSLQSDLDSTTNRLIDILLKMTAYNDASKKLAPHESTGLWGEALLLLKKNKPSEAKTIIFKMDEVGGLSSKDAQWLLGIALLEEGKLDEAQALFEKIAKDPMNPRRKDAQTVVDALK